MLQHERDRKVVITTSEESLKRELVRRGFEVVGQINDNVTAPRVYTLWGKKLAIEPRYMASLEVVSTARFKQKAGSTDIYTKAKNLN